MKSKIGDAKHQPRHVEKSEGASVSFVWQSLMKNKISALCLEKVGPLKLKKLQFSGEMTIRVSEIPIFGQ